MNGKGVTMDNVLNAVNGKPTNENSSPQKSFEGDVGTVTVNDESMIPTITIGNAAFIDVKLEDLTHEELGELIGDKLHLSVSKEVIEKLSPELKKKVIAKGIIDKL
jgi:hypothetical protein